jgi:TonB family protein
LHALFAAGVVLINEVEWRSQLGSSNASREITVASLPHNEVFVAIREQEHETEVPPVLEVVEIVEEAAVLNPPQPVKPLEKDPLLEEDPFEDLDLEALETLEAEELPLEEPLGEEPEELRQLLESPAPAYPEDALLRRLEGTVHLSLTVDPSGKVVGVELSKSSGHGSLDRAAIEAARRYQFEAGEGTITVSKPFTFRLS